MKKIICLLLALVLCSLAFCGCDSGNKNGKNDAEKILGTWEWSINVGNFFEVMFEEIYEEGGEYGKAMAEMFDFLDLDEVNYTCNIVFKNDGTVGLGVANCEDVVKSFENVVRRDLPRYFTYVAEKAIEEENLDMTVDEYLEERLGATLEEYIDEYLEIAIPELINDLSGELIEEGEITYQIKNGKLYTYDSESEACLTYSFIGNDTLVIIGAIGEADEFFEAFGPLTWTKVK